MSNQILEGYLFNINHDLCNNADAHSILQSTIAIGAKSNTNVQQAKKLVTDFLGEQAIIKTNKHGDKIFISSDGMRKVRFDINYSRGDLPHMHFAKKIIQWPVGR